MLSFNLYLITDRSLTKKGLIDSVKQALNAGIKAVQLREKDLSIKELVTLADSLRKITEQYGAMLFINDRVDVALCTGADGVQLNSTSIPVKAVRKFVKDDLYIGVSCHSLKEAANAQDEGADFVTLGPAFETPSKIKYGSPIGLLPIRNAKKSLKIPIFAIGGIKLDHVTGIMKCGADGIALISGILAQDDVYGASIKYLELLK
ncbi:MAG: thiamine phosphate synthase [Nitrospirae bacterium]|nr:thiamine phosphate synthase [Nitrospirota bacterium]